MTKDITMVLKIAPMMRLIKEPRNSVENAIDIKVIKVIKAMILNR
jgi:hypothetical protein